MTDRGYAVSLSNVYPQLAIHYGAAYVRAILARDGDWTALALDGTQEMSAAVHVSRGPSVVTGAAAWQRATEDPDGFVLSPLQAGTGQVVAGSVQVEVAELVAATLREVAAQAHREAGGPVDDVRLVVPAAWGPRRQLWMRGAARAAGLPVSRVVAAPVAAAMRLAAGAGTDAVAGQSVLIVDVGAGVEASVVQYGSGGWEILSTLADDGAGGDRIDAGLAHTLTASDLDDLEPDQRWQLLASLRAARHSLSEQIAVSMPMPGGQPPMIVNAGLVAEAARPVFERAAGLAAQALSNADLTIEQVSEVWLIGAAAVTPAAAEMIAVKLGSLPLMADLPALTAVLGAAEAGDAAGEAVGGSPRVPLRRLLALSVPGVASLLLFAHFVLSADFNNGTPQHPGPGYYVLASWGELAVAAVLAVLCFLRAASVFTILFEQHHAATRAAGSEAAPQERMTGGLGLSVAAGLAACGLYAITAAVYFNEHAALALRWSLLPALPTVVSAIVLTALARNRLSVPGGNWDAFVSFPLSSMMAAAAGTFALSMWWTGPLPLWLHGWGGTLGRSGGLLIGVAIACALVRHLAGRVALAVTLGFFTAIISRSGPGIPAVLYALAAALWWNWHAWTLIRTQALRRTTG